MDDGVTGTVYYTSSSSSHGVTADGKTTVRFEQELDDNGKQIVDRVVVGNTVVDLLNAEETVYGWDAIGYIDGNMTLIYYLDSYQTGAGQAIYGYIYANGVNNIFLADREDQRTQNMPSSGTARYLGYRESILMGSALYPYYFISLDLEVDFDNKSITGAGYLKNYETIINTPNFRRTEVLSNIDATFSGNEITNGSLDINKDVLDNQIRNSISNYHIDNLHGYFYGDEGESLAIIGGNSDVAFVGSAVKKED